MVTSAIDTTATLVSTYISLMTPTDFHKTSKTRDWCTAADVINLKQLCRDQNNSIVSKRICQPEHTHTHPFNGPFSRTTQVSQYQKGKTNLDFTEARDSEWQWHQLGHKQVCTSLQTDNHASTPPLSFLQAGCPSCRPTNSIKALKAT